MIMNTLKIIIHATKSCLNQSLYKRNSTRDDCMCVCVCVWLQYIHNSCGSGQILPFLDHYPTHSDPVDGNIILLSLLFPSLPFPSLPFSSLLFSSSHNKVPLILYLILCNTLVTPHSLLSTINTTLITPYYLLLSP